MKNNFFYHFERLRRKTWNLINIGGEGGGQNRGGKTALGGDRPRMCPPLRKLPLKMLYHNYHNPPLPPQSLPQASFSCKIFNYFFSGGRFQKLANRIYITSKPLKPQGVMQVTKGKKFKEEFKRKKIYDDYTKSAL